MTEQLVSHRVFGNETKPTIYYVNGYGDGGTIRKFRPHTWLLGLLGFRIMAFEYGNAILNAGDPTKLPEAIRTIADLIRQDMKSHKTAGIYGVSLGSFIGLNLLSLCDIEKGMFNTGGVSVTKTIWDNPHLTKEKAAFVSNGYARASLEKHWASYEVNEDASRLQHKTILLMISTGDTVLPYVEAARNATAWHRAGIRVSLVTSRGMGHSTAIVRNLFRILRTRRFFV